MSKRTKSAATSAAGDPCTALDDALARGLRARGTRAAHWSSEAAQSASSQAAAAAAGRVGARIAAEGLADVSYAPVESPFGRLLVAVSRRGLVRVAFPEENVDAVLELLAQRISPRIIESPGPLESVRRELEEYFSGARRSFDLPLDWRLIGSFAHRVLQVTYAIPYGRVLSYGEVAADAGSPRGSRAAGNALGANPIPIVIPCHRVVRAGGALGGYGGGPQRKRWLLELEGALQRDS
jgi:methylated-DNA-[protein]-cysteine S-methyltransferase